MRTKDALIGLAVGDALGVPVEFMERSVILENPVQEMRAYGTYDQPMGTWSDDSSLTFCLADSLIEGFDLIDMAERFVLWKHQAYWSARGEVFDIGITSAVAIDQLAVLLAQKQFKAIESLGNTDDERTNGNGSLMRILPLYFYLQHEKIEDHFATIWAVSALTHAHLRAAIACLIYLIFADELVQQKSASVAYAEMQKRMTAFLTKNEGKRQEAKFFQRILEEDIDSLPENEIRSDGYVVHSLEAALWCLLRGCSYEEVVLAAVNLGADTDTTAAIAGGLAGLQYGWESIPRDWRESLARYQDILKLSEALHEVYFEK